MTYASSGKVETQDYNNLANGLSLTVTDGCISKNSWSGGATLTGGGTYIQKTGGTNNTWTGQGYSAEGYTSNVYVSAKPYSNTNHLMFGLNSDPATDSTYNSIDYCWYCHSSGTMYIYESGAQIGTTYGSYTAATVLSISYDGTNVVYWKDGVAQRTVARAIGAPLYLDSSFYDNPAYIYDVELAPLTALTYSANCDGGGGVIYSTATAGGWDRGAYSTVGYTDSAFVSARASQTNVHMMIGLNSDPATDNSYASIDYAWYLAADGALAIYESGASILAGIGAYTTSTVLAVGYDGANIKYYKDGRLVRTVARSIGSALYLDSSFYPSGAMNSVTFLPAPHIGDTWGVGGKHTGMGQSTSSIASVNTTNTVTATQWTSLISTINNCLAHQGQAAISPTSVTAGNNVTYYTSIAKGAALAYGLNGTTGLSLTAGTTNTTSYVGAWGTTGNQGLQFAQSITFASGDAARYFFNAGGNISISYDRSGGSATTSNTDWTALATACSTLKFGHQAITKTGGSGTPTTMWGSGYPAGSVGGYWNCTHAPQTMFLQYDSAVGYTQNYIQVTAQWGGTESNGGYPILYLYSYWIDAHTGTGVQITDGTASTSIVVNSPATTYLTNTWGTPTFSGSVALY